MREIFSGRVVMCNTSITDRSSCGRETERSFLEVEFGNDPDDRDATDLIYSYSPRYKGRADLVGKKVRVIVEVDE